MRESPDRPVAVRATAFVADTPWRSRPVRRVSFDALWPDGRVEVDVSLASTMHQHPADFSAFERQIQSTCPEIGTGPWTDEFGRVVDGPDVNTLPASTVRRGRPQVFSAPRSAPDANARHWWRTGFGVVSLGIGALLVIGPLRDSPAGFVGVVSTLAGLAALAGSIPRAKRWW
jgi:hypothetical protein